MNNFIFSLSMSGKSVIEELWDYFVTNYIEASTAYPNLGMEGNSMVNVPMIVIGVCLGALIGVIFAMYDNKVIGEYVRKMLEGGHVGKENAVTLEYLGTGERSSFGRALIRSVSLRRYVHCVEEELFAEENQGKEAPAGKKKVNEYKHAVGEHFYIPEDKKIGAEFKYIKRGLKWWAIPIVIVGLVVAFFALVFVLPYILSLLDAFVGTFKS